MQLNPITLAPTPGREVVDLAKAESMIETWRSQLLEHQAALSSASLSQNGNGDHEANASSYPPLCDTIILSNKSYTPEAAELLASFLTSSHEFCPSLASGIQNAILSDIIASQPEAQGLEVLSTFSNAFQNSCLKYVDLSDNAMGSKGVMACKEVLGGKAVQKSLECLKLCNNGLSETTMEEVACLLTGGEESESCIAENLKILHFFNNMSGNNGCKSFAKIMDHCTEKLEDVCMSGTRARAEGSRYIAESLSEAAKRGHLKNLQRLDLKDNTFTEEKSYRMLAQALETCSALQYLNLHDCVLQDEGVKLVCDALRRAKAPLEYLNLGGNEVTHMGAKSVARLVKEINGTLVTFCMGENDELTSRGVKRIMDVLDSKTLEHVVLNLTCMGTMGVEAIVEMKDRVPNLKILEVDENRIPLASVEKLEDAFGEVLKELEDNDDEEDADDDLEEEEESEEEEEEEENLVSTHQQATPKEDAMDSLTSALENVTV